MLSLVRDTYPPDDPLDDLLAPNHFDTRESVEEYLLDRILIAAYTPRPGRPAPHCTPTQARHWLGYIARQMALSHTRTLAWWQVVRWRPARFRVVSTILTIWFVLGFGFGFAFYFTTSDGFAWHSLTFGLVFGLVVGLAHGRGGSEPRQWGRIRWKVLTSRDGIRVGLALGLVVGLPVWVSFGLVYGFTYGLVAGPASGFGIGLAGCLMYAAAHSPADPLSAVFPLTSWRRDRRYSVIIGLTFGFILEL
jgi:hypothetical protein